jgi:hypothetical protein
MWPAAHFRQLQAVQVGLILSSWEYFSSATPTAQRSRLAGGINSIPCGHSVEAATFREVIYPGEQPWGSACSCRVAPFLFSCPIDGVVLYILPLPSHVGPHLEVQHAVKIICHPNELMCGSVGSYRVAHVHFRLSTRPGFEPVSTCLWGPRLLLQVMKRTAFLVI